MTDVTHKRPSEQTLRQEILKQASTMSSEEINKKINTFIEILNKGKLEGEARLMAQEKAKIYAEIWLRRKHR